MKCFKVVNASFSRGFRIQETSDERPYVSITTGYFEEGEKLPLADPLVEKLQDNARRSLFQEESTHILACDIDERGQFWLIPETEESKDELLVYVVENHYVDKKKQGSVVFSFSEEGCDVLLRTDKADMLKAHFGTLLNLVGEALLVRLKPGGWLRVVRTTMTPRSILSPARVRGDTYTTDKSGYFVRYADLVAADKGKLD
jgi:hypothetical protein